MSQYTVENPHPEFGKNPNIINELGHTRYPRWVKNSAGERVVVKDEDEELEVTGEIENKKSKKKEAGWTK